MARAKELEVDGVSIESCFLSGFDEGFLAVSISVKALREISEKLG